MKTNTLAFFERFKGQIRDDMLIKSVFKDNNNLVFEIELSPYEKEQNVIFALSYPYFDDLDLFISSFDEIRHKKKKELGDRYIPDLQHFTVRAETSLHDLIHKFQEVVDKQGVKYEQ